MIGQFVRCFSGHLGGNALDARLILRHAAVVCVARSRPPRGKAVPTRFAPRLSSLLKVTDTPCRSIVIMSGQKCYYPNGDDSKQDDIPCGEGDGVACCPENWECLGNGVCHLAAQNYYSRFTCTDKSWQSDGCPKFCTEGALDSRAQSSYS